VDRNYTNLGSIAEMDFELKVDAHVFDRSFNTNEWLKRSIITLIPTIVYKKSRQFRTFRRNWISYVRNEVFVHPVWAYYYRPVYVKSSNCFELPHTSGRVRRTTRANNNRSLLALRKIGRPIQKRNVSPLIRYARAREHTINVNAADDNG